MITISMNENLFGLIVSLLLLLLPLFFWMGRLFEEDDESVLPNMFGALAILALAVGAALSIGFLVVGFIDGVS